MSALLQRREAGAHGRSGNQPSAGVETPSGERVPDTSHRTDAEEGAPARPGTDGRDDHGLPVAQRTSGVLQRAKPKSAAVKELAQKLPLVQANARLIGAYSNLGESYVQFSMVNTDLISTKLQIFSINYDQAYAKYASVIGQGRAEAQNQTLWRGIFLGIGTGVLAGLAAAFIAPSTAAAWFTLTLADAATAAGSSLLQAGASATLAYALSDVMTARGSDLQPGGLSPDVLRTQVWKNVAAMYRGAFDTTKVLSNLRKNNLRLERLIAEMRVTIAGGASGYSPEDVVAAADVMNARMTTMRPVFDGLSSKSDGMKTLSTLVSQYDPQSPGIAQLEKDIWIMWIGSLSDADSDILDLDAIEDHLQMIGILGRGGILGVDFGDYTSEKDELAAIAAGRKRAGSIRARYDQATSRWVEPTP